MKQKSIDEVVKDLQDKDRNLKVIDGITVELRISEFVREGAIRIVEGDSPGVSYVVISRTPPSLDHVIIALRQARITHGRLPDEELAALQQFYMTYGTLPAEYPMPPRIT